MKIAKFNGQPEIYYSIQGEGKNSGRPSVFVRLSHCNLSCIWCDTPYTWNWEKFKMREEMMEMPVQEVASEIKKYSCKHVVLTGGEPMLQQKELIEFMRFLTGKNYFFEVETNATLIPTPEFNLFVNQYNCSPKLANSENSLNLREEKGALEFFSKSPKAFFKFVIVFPQDLQEVCQLTDRYKIPKEKIYLMSEGTTSEELKERQRWLAGLCKETGFLLTDRLQIHIHGPKRGV
ncbi:MAG: 7-carboxy-7-deazaguanine synthase QueE [Deltaproteobacteria bacterium RIFCSPLOWO2_01_44_7]|nr:MAG: 7-carboxy-7-deazaguanine synthase QueE [Deltaproteobacteria bacterium RIFCSPHIGHO2_01_FULL_43_49]OGQ15301.1 MAG: 7-carboxy-7-deazaguanine synthase QueE [Deltaproteobacteria bacterium RIFCSPHIGHO2_02_FULL_44_53]OGQ27075.1 MAG: 7-carboxy-7-deazaguanine synthase QueE [Deltaproteobacteria bacterium RIFCSPHIGHO2_12_FULL_44_21]OGQ31817.1 MAG: 7-carboxy-7-deazaguanine synthase QueE [Deltaproteobacteria bacterium RIFCSPLOWO2_01_FULL_45_74]OGQ37631.1 MAG: 7-carboxy-7-deazaguanine synthase QueE [